jgi:hypothetical protein
VGCGKISSQEQGQRGTELQIGLPGDAQTACERHFRLKKAISQLKMYGQSKACFYLIKQL